MLMLDLSWEWLRTQSPSLDGGIDGTAISLWENETDAEAYNTNTYPQVLKTMTRFIEGTPKVQTSDV